MAKTYTLSTSQRMANALFGVLTERGLGARYRHMLCVRGRTTGRPHSTPVDVMQVGGTRWLVAPYGEVNWVRNVRAADGELMLSRGKHIDTMRAREVAPAEAVPVLRKYMKSVPVTRAYWDVTAASTDEQIAADARNHPVFALSPVSR